MNKVYKTIDVSQGGSLIGEIDTKALLDVCDEWSAFKDKYRYDDNYSKDCKHPDKYREGLLLSSELEEFEKRVAFEKAVSANADALISLGLKEWYRTRRKHKPPKKKKGQEDQLREIEDKLVEDRVERT